MRDVLERLIELEFQAVEQGRVEPAWPDDNQKAVAAAPHPSRITTKSSLLKTPMPSERPANNMSRRCRSCSPIFQVMLVLQNASMPQLEIDGLRLLPVEIAGEVSKFDLTFFLSEEREGIRGNLEYNTDLFDASTADELICRFVDLLAALPAGVGERISMVGLAPLEDEGLIGAFVEDLEA